MRSKQRGKFDFLTEEKQQRDEPPQEVIESAQSSKSTNAQPSVERRPSGQRIRADLLRAYKIWSAETGTPQYVLIEAALEAYLATKSTN